MVHMDQPNISQLVAYELRKRGDKSVRSLFWNVDRGDLTVYAKSHTPEVPKSFNFLPAADLTVEEIATMVAARCEELNKK